MLIYARFARSGQVRSVFPVITDNRCKLQFDWMKKNRNSFDFCMIFDVTSQCVAPMSLPPCVGARQICAASGCRHMATPEQAGLALLCHMVICSPNELKYLFPYQSSQMDFMLRLPNCTDKHQMLIILTNPTSDIWILRLTKQTCWRDFGKTAVR